MTMTSINYAFGSSSSKMQTCVCVMQGGQEQHKTRSKRVLTEGGEVGVGDVMSRQSFNKHQMDQQNRFRTSTEGVELETQVRPFDRASSPFPHACLPPPLSQPPQPPPGGKPKQRLKSVVSVPSHPSPPVREGSDRTEEGDRRGGHRK